MKKIISTIKEEKMGVIVIILFLLSLLPVIYVGLFNYASGDDYWYGVNTYRGWIETGIIGALKGSFITVKEFYESWQGTWFTMFLFTLSPNHFWEGGYVITVFLSLGLLIFSFFYLGYFYLVKILEFRKSTFCIILCSVSYLAIQYIPRTTSGIYWFNGIMHYTVPFFLGALAIVHSHKYLLEKKKRDYAILFLCFTLLGGGSYLVPVSATIIIFVLLILPVELGWLKEEKKKIIIKYDKKNLWILLAILSEMTGLLISFLAPGNQVRGGEEFGFSIKWALECVYYAIDRGIYLGVDYFEKNMVNTFVYFILILVIWLEMWQKEYLRKSFRYPIVFVLLMNGVYWASYTPEIYSRSDVSGGVTNTYYHIFLLITLANIIYVHGWIINFIKSKRNSKLEKRIDFIVSSKIIKIAIVVFGMAGVFAVERIDGVKSTNDYCMEYVQSGKIYEYSQLRKEQHRILSESPQEEVEIWEMGEQYPLLHMSLEENPEAQRNIDRALYYGKKSVRAKMVAE